MSKNFVISYYGLHKAHMFFYSSDYCCFSTYFPVTNINRYIFQFTIPATKALALSQFLMYSHFQ